MAAGGRGSRRLHSGSPGFPSHPGFHVLRSAEKNKVSVEHSERRREPLVGYGLLSLPNQPWAKAKPQNSSMKATLLTCNQDMAPQQTEGNQTRSGGENQQSDIEDRPKKKKKKGSYPFFQFFNVSLVWWRNDKHPLHAEPPYRTHKENVFSVQV